MKTTFNTGKVQIGKYYEPPKRFESSLDMDLIQRALITKRRPPSRWLAVYGVTLASVLAALFLMR